jgi:hypothetical protein
MTTDPHTSPASPRRLLALLAASALALGACAGGSVDDAVDSAGAGQADVHDAADAAEAEAPIDDVSRSEEGTVDAGGVDLAAVADGRHIISTAQVDLTAPDADAVTAGISDLVAEVGGFVSAADTSRVDGTRTTMVLRVPPEAFDDVLGQLAELGELTAQRIETEEVTQQVVDLGSRITTAEASVVRLRELLDRTGSVAEIAQVETELLARETTLQTLRGQLRTIERQVELATITVHVDAEDAAPVVDDDDRLPSFLGGLGTGWDALVLSLAGVAALVGVLLPWLAVLALVGVPAWWLIRSRRRPTPPVPNPA